jgi:hypothetical protein
MTRRADLFNPVRARLARAEEEKALALAPPRLSSPSHPCLSTLEGALSPAPLSTQARRYTIRRTNPPPSAIVSRFAVMSLCVRMQPDG